MITTKQLTEELFVWNFQEHGEEASYISAVLDNLEESLGRGPVPLPSGDLELVEQFGGEGEGDNYWLVFKVEDQFFKVEGFHSSWEGVNWEDSEIKEVEAREVTVIQYFYK